MSGTDRERLAEDGMCPNCLTPWKCSGPHLLPYAVTPDDWRSAEIDWKERAEAAEAKVARVQEILGADGQWYSGPLLYRTLLAALDEQGHA